MATCTHSVVLRHAEILLSGYGDSPGITNNNKLLEYCSLMKEHPWAEHLTSLSKRGAGALLSVSAFNHERVPCHVYSCSIPSKQQTITYNGITSRFQVKSSQILVCPSMQRCPVLTFGEVLHEVSYLRYV